MMKELKTGISEKCQTWIEKYFPEKKALVIPVAQSTQKQILKFSGLVKFCLSFFFFLLQIFFVELYLSTKACYYNLVIIT